MLKSAAFYSRQTKSFACYDKIPGGGDLLQKNQTRDDIPEHAWFLYVDWNCKYTRRIIEDTIKRRYSYCRIISDMKTDPNLEAYRHKFNGKHPKILQLSDFENIQWEYVLSERTMASSYLIRKGLSRKAQLSLQIQRFLKKRSDSILQTAVPETHIIETWDVFQDEDSKEEDNNNSSKISFGSGLSLQFDHLYDWKHRTSIKQKLQWHFTNNIELLFYDKSVNEQDQEVITAKDTSDRWILKPSVTNKGVDIAIISNYDQLLEILEEQSSIREWVLQKYLPNPLLLQHRRHKFHLRVYIVCVGALQVFLYEEILLLFAAHRYRSDDFYDIYAHLTNTARAAETENFQEEKFVKTLRDLPALLRADYPDRVPDEYTARTIQRQILEQMKAIIHDLFQSYENEYSIFTPMMNCFELYGLDFLVDDQFQVTFLECNPGPDFQQTGHRLSLVIEELFESLFRLLIDFPLLAPNSKSSENTNNFFCEQYQHAEIQSWLRQWIPSLTLVYSKSWSVNQLKSSMTFIEE